MNYNTRFRRISDDELRKLRDDSIVALRQAMNCGDKKEKRNAQRKLDRVIDEQDRRRLVNRKTRKPAPDLSTGGQTI